MKFRKKPVVIEAIQFTGVNGLDVATFCKGAPLKTFGDSLVIPTLEGDHRADVGDWIIKGVNGEFYPCKPDIFDKTYEPPGKKKSREWWYRVLGFAVRMIDRFEEKDDDGWRGWDEIEEESYQNRAIKNIKERNYVDGANLCLLADRAKGSHT